jgi:hypothetical protein
MVFTLFGNSWPLGCCAIYKVAMTKEIPKEQTNSLLGAALGGLASFCPSYNASATKFLAADELSGLA